MALTDTQLAERRSGIGGSDAPVILGVNPFKTALTLYHEKRGDIPPDDMVDNRFVEWGNILEPAVAAKYAERTGRKIRVDNTTHRSKAHPHMLAHIDRRVVGTKERRALEVKTTSIFAVDGWGEDGSSEVPATVFCQLQHYIYVLDLDVIDTAVLVGGSDYRQYEIFRHDKMIEQLIEAEEEFWDRVQAGEPPEAQFEHRDTVALIEKLYPGTNGSVVRLPEIAMKWADVQEDARKQRLMYEKVEAGCANRIAMLMGSAAIGVLPDNTCYERKLIPRKAFDVPASSHMRMDHKEKVPVAALEALASEEAPTKTLENVNAIDTTE
jgi:putative phage-type endonuclease